MASSHLIEKRRTLIAEAENKHRVILDATKKEMDDLADKLYLDSIGNISTKIMNAMSKEEMKEKVYALQEKMKQIVFLYDDYLQMADKEYWEYEKLYMSDSQYVMESVHEWMKPALIAWLRKDFEEWKRVSYIEGGDIFSRRSWNFNVMAGHIETTTGTGNMFLFSMNGMKGFKTIGQQAGAAIAIAEYMKEILQAELPLYTVTYLQNDNHIYFSL